MVEKSIHIDVIRNQVFVGPDSTAVRPREALYLLSLYANPAGLIIAEVAECLKRRRTDSADHETAKSIASMLASSRQNALKAELMKQVFKRDKILPGYPGKHAVHRLVSPETTTLELARYMLYENGNYYLPAGIQIDPSWTIVDIGTHTVGTLQTDTCITPFGEQLAITIIDRPEHKFTLEELVAITSERIAHTIDFMGAYDNLREVLTKVPQIKAEGLHNRRIYIEANQHITYGIHKPGYRRIHEVN